MILKGSIQQEDLTILNIYAPNVGAAKYINQLITKVKTYLDNNTLILGDFNLVLSTLNRSSRHNIAKETRDLFLFFLIFLKFIYDRHRQRERGRDTGRGRSRLHAPGARRGTRSRVSRITPWAKGRRQTTAPPRDPSIGLLNTTSPKKRGL